MIAEPSRFCLGLLSIRHCGCCYVELRRAVHASPCLAQAVHGVEHTDDLIKCIAKRPTIHVLCVFMSAYYRHTIAGICWQMVTGCHDSPARGLLPGTVAARVIASYLRDDVHLLKTCHFRLGYTFWHSLTQWITKYRQLTN